MAQQLRLQAAEAAKETDKGKGGNKSESVCFHHELDSNSAMMGDNTSMAANSVGFRKP